MKPGTRKHGTSSADRVMSIGNFAARLFSKRGYIETSMEDISASAKLSKGGIYHYFDGKDEILEWILSSFLDRVLENAEQDLRDVAEPIDRIRAVIRRHVKTYSENMYAAKVLLHEAHNLPAAKLRKIKGKERRYFQTISTLLSSYQGGRVDKAGLTVLTFNLLGMCNWIYSWYDPKGVVSPDQLAEMIFETFTRGLSGVHGGPLRADNKAE